MRYDVINYQASFQVGIYVSRTWRKKNGLIVGLIVAATHLLFLVYLHFAYHSVYEGMLKV